MAEGEQRSQIRRTPSRSTRTACAANGIMASRLRSITRRSSIASQSDVIRRNALWNCSTTPDRPASGPVAGRPPPAARPDRRA